MAKRKFRGTIVFQGGKGASQQQIDDLKEYVDESMAGAGAVRGVPCQINQTTPITGGTRVTFLWEDNNGDPHTTTLDVMNGEAGNDGEDAPTITGITLLSDKSLQFTMSDGSSFETTAVPTAKGDPGDDGFSPVITVKESSDSTYVLHIVTADDEFDTPNLKGSGGTSDPIQVDELPSPSSTLAGKIYEFTGTTGTYTNGYFYQCVESATPGTYEWVQKNVQPGGGGGSADLQTALTATKTVGGVTAGDTFAQGTSLETVIRSVLSPVLYPSFTAPSATLSATGSKLLEKGGSLSTTFTATFNRGAITPAYGTSGYRSGEATGYKLNNGESQVGNTWAVTVTESQLTYQANVSYAAGEQPKDSSGANYSSPLPAGNLNTNTITYEFVDALWANTASISTVAKLSLTSKSTKLKEFNFPSATAANPEIFDVPSSWTVTAVEVLNTLNNQWEDCSSEFTTSSVIHKNAGDVDTNYDRYTCNLGYDMGARKVRVKWS